MVGITKVKFLDKFSYKDNLNIEHKDKFTLSDLEDFLHIESYLFGKKNLPSPHRDLKKNSKEEKEKFLFSEESIEELRKYIINGIEYYNKVISSGKKNLHISYKEESENTLHIILSDKDDSTVYFERKICLNCIKTRAFAIKLFSDMISHKGLMIDEST